MAGDDTVTITVDELLTETEAARLYLIDDAKVWIPKSVHSWDEADDLAKGFDIEVAEWFAEKEDLI